MKKTKKKNIIVTRSTCCVLWLWPTTPPAPPATRGVPASMGLREALDSPSSSRPPVQRPWGYRLNLCSYSVGELGWAALPAVTAGSSSATAPSSRAAAARPPPPRTAGWSRSSAHAAPSAPPPWFCSSLSERPALLMTAQWRSWNCVNRCRFQGKWVMLKYHVFLNWNGMVRFFLYLMSCPLQSPSALCLLVPGSAVVLPVEPVLCLTRLWLVCWLSYKTEHFVKLSRQ